MGSSSSTAISTQNADAFMSQQFSGSCNVNCTNIQSGVNIDLINTVVGGNVSLEQTCSVDASCMMSNASDATSDVFLKAINSTNAKNASNLFDGSIGNVTDSYTESRQNIKQTIIQNTSQACNMSSLNQMKNINILAANSKIGGNVNISQDGKTKGNCQLGNTFTAAAVATAMADNKATSGKDKKGQKKGGSAPIITIIALIGVVIVIGVLAKMYTSSRESSTASAAMMRVAEARAAAGCYGGKRPIIDSLTGKAVIDPVSMRPICPPPPVPNIQSAVSSTPVINLSIPSSSPIKSIKNALHLR